MKKIGVLHYGKSSNFDDRKKLESLNRHDLNFYSMRKRRPFLRSHIDIEYTKEWLTAFRDFVDFSKTIQLMLVSDLHQLKQQILDLKEKIKVFRTRYRLFFYSF